MRRLLHGAGRTTQPATIVGLLLAVMLSTPNIARAQSRGEPAPRTIVGLVRDSTGLPVVGVQVRVDGRQLALTDSVGRFRLFETSSAVVTLTFRRLGYEPVTRRIAARDSAAPVEVVITPNSQLLRTVVIEGQAYDRDLWANGFYHRQKTASGSFFDPDFLAHFAGSGVGSLLHEVSRVEVQRRNNQDYAFSTVGGNRCRMNVFVDGRFERAAMPSPTGREEGVGLADLVDYRDILAVEVYPRTMSVPTQFSRMGPGTGRQGRPMVRIPSPGNIHISTSEQNSDAACGAIVIWTRAPGEK